MVQFEDGSIKAQLGPADMKVPIQYALHYPERKKLKTERLDFIQIAQLHFESFDRQIFKNVDLAYLAMENKGTMACALNAANEIAVELFLQEKINFLQIAEINEKTMLNISNKLAPSLADYKEVDKEARIFARNCC
jgi:1-deoxy-D-xylulose-5-phosphate reductoisomerase